MIDDLRVAKTANFYSLTRMLSNAAVDDLFTRIRAGQRIRDRICGFVLLVEHRNHVAVFKSKLELPASFSTRYLGRVSAERIDLAVARRDAVFEKIRLRNMSLSKHVMRN